MWVEIKFRNIITAGSHVWAVNSTLYIYIKLVRYWYLTYVLKASNVICVYNGILEYVIPGKILNNNTIFSGVEVNP